MVLPVEGYNKDAKHKYFSNFGATLADSLKNWSLTNTILNKARIFKIPPLLENDNFDVEFKTKARVFNCYFILQCSTLNTGSDIMQNSTFNVAMLFYISKSDDKILKIIRSRKGNKAHGWDDTSLFTIAKDPKTAVDDMNRDLIQLWANKWRMSFKPDPRK